MTANNTHINLERTSEDDMRQNEDINMTVQDINAENKLHESCPLPHASIQDTDDNTSRRRRVSFDSINIREYFIELGDNPSCRNGPPLTIGWDFDELGRFDLEQFEEFRPPRRFSRQMIIPLGRRQEILFQSGYSASDFVETMDDINIEKFFPHQPNKISTKLNIINNGVVVKNKMKLMFRSGKTQRRRFSM